MAFRAVLFDLDGTLLDTLEDLADSMNAALAAAGLPGHPASAYRYFVGDGVIELARRVLPEGRRDEASARALAAAMREEYARRWDRKTRPYEGIPELLDTLSARGIALAVLSNKPHDFTALTVAKFLPRWTFLAVRGVESGGPRKPDPAGALEAARLIGAAPGEFVYLGDTDTDMRTAVAAGMFPVGALWGFRRAEELIVNGAKALIERPGDLLQLLG